MDPNEIGTGPSVELALSNLKKRSVNKRTSVRKCVGLIIFLRNCQKIS